MVNNIAISTSAFCLWDIGPERKLNICKDLGFERIVIAFSTLKMLRDFASSAYLCGKLAQFSHVVIHAPWCGVRYKNNKATQEVFGHLEKIMSMVPVEAVIFHYDSIENLAWFENCTFPYYIKNPCRASWESFNHALQLHGFDSVLDINRASRFENYMDQYLNHHKEQLKAVHVSGFVNELGRTPLIESGQIELLDKVKKVDAPIIIEGLFSPGDFQGIREEVRMIQEIVYG